MTLEPAPTLHVATATVGYRTVFDVSGEIDIATIGLLTSALDAALHSADREVWIDLSAVPFMSSAGVHALMRAHRELDRDGRRLAIICPSGPVRRVIQVAGVADALPLFESRAIAQRALF
jgi:anti-sigma B factor antagonist